MIVDKEDATLAMGRNIGACTLAGPRREDRDSRKVEAVLRRVTTVFSFIFTVWNEYTFGDNKSILFEFSWTWLTVTLLRI